VSSDAQIVLAVAVVGWIFSGGVFYAWTKAKIGELARILEEMKGAFYRDINGLRADLEKEIKTARTDLYRDINGIGNKLRQDEDSAARRHQNISLAIVAAAPPSKEAEICGLLREDR
jgi:hypothetical protein